MGHTSKNILIIGASSLALEMAEILKGMKHNVTNYEFSVNENLEDFLKHCHESSYDSIYLGIYSRKIAFPIIKTFRKEINHVTFSCLNASISDLSTVNSEGTYVSNGVTISNNVSIGSFCYIGLNASIGHDAIIEDYVTIMPGARISGNARICSGAVIGSNAVIHQGRTIKKNVYVEPCQYV